jgi:UDP-N-acetylglucosamine acyltransferase
MGTPPRGPAALCRQRPATPAKPFGINSEGLRRRGFSADAIARIKQAYRTLYRSGLGLEEARRQLAALAASCVEVGALLEFLERSKRGVIR